MRSLERYNERARECWEVAEKLRGDDARQQLRELAIFWQRLSEKAAQVRDNLPPSLQRNCRLLSAVFAAFTAQFAQFLRHLQQSCLCFGIESFLSNTKTLGGVSPIRVCSRH